MRVGSGLRDCHHVERGRGGDFETAAAEEFEGGEGVQAQGAEGVVGADELVGEPGGEDAEVGLACV